jgi:hypothetical protein
MVPDSLREKQAQELDRNSSNKCYAARIICKISKTIGQRDYFMLLTYAVEFLLQK